MKQKLRFKCKAVSIPPMYSLLMLALLGTMPFKGVSKEREVAWPNVRAAYGQSGMQQNTSVSGQVKDAAGQPLPGVSVALKGTATGTVTAGTGCERNAQKPHSKLEPALRGGLPNR